MASSKGQNRSASVSKSNKAEAGKKGKKGKKDADAAKQLPQWRKTALATIPIVSGAISMAVLALRAVGEGPMAEIAVKCTTLAYPVQQEDGSVRYLRGTEDIYFLVWGTFAAAFSRYITCEMSVPVARLWGMKDEVEIQKFKEQAGQFVWYSVAWLAGLQIVNTEWNYFDTDQLWIGYPHTQMTAVMKVFYLGQLSHWISLIFITPLETHRSDFWASMAHHFLTSTLVATSYWLHFTRVGIAILVEQDLADIVLPVAKMFRYANFRTASDITFAFFACLWIPTRHFMYMYIYWSIAVDAPRLLKDVKYDPENGSYWYGGLHVTYMVALGAFQGLMLYWLKYLLQAVYRALVAGHIDDHRSDDDEKTETKKGKSE